MRFELNKRYLSGYFQTPEQEAANERMWQKERKKEEEELRKYPREVRNIYNMIYLYSDELSDGFEYYGGHSSVLKLANKIYKRINKKK